MERIYSGLNGSTIMDTWLIVFVALTAIAILLQAGILGGMFLAVRKTGAKVEALAEEVKTKVLPTAELAHSMISEMRPKIENIVDNVSTSSTMMRTQMERVDATLTDIVDRTRLQVIRADEFVNSTMDKLEETREAVQRTVVSPVRQISGLMHGVTAGVEAFFSRKRERGPVNVPQDEMFI
jgi:methyl-accepting chemotaxis protein